MTKKRPYIIFHILGWLTFIAFQVILLPNPKSIFYNKESYPYIIDQLIINFLVILFFYFTHYLLIPKFYFKKKWIAFILLILIFVGSSVEFVLLRDHKNTKIEIPTNTHGVPVFSENPLAPPKPKENKMHLELLSEQVILVGSLLLKFILVFLLSVGIRVYDKWQQAEKEKYKAELSFLKAQINPHFLFNTLNGIYALAIKESENTAPSIMSLSSIMRYVISDAHLNFVELEKELKYIDDYINLQKMRFSQNIDVDFSVIAKNKNYKIAPLILIPFVENAFKHGISTEKDCKLKIEILIENNNLILYVENSKYNTVLKEEEKSGIGIENTIKRLKVLYPNKYELKISNLKEQYKVTLKLQLI